ncbi:hypothetical protein TSMEX_003311 [Taenia solium]|eukprot:TsM_001184500 transcript=TsM_001184500 gene=TsM_001184500
MAQILCYRKQDSKAKGTSMVEHGELVDRALIERRPCLTAGETDFSSDYTAITCRINGAPCVRRLIEVQRSAAGRALPKDRHYRF